MRPEGVERGARARAEKGEETRLTVVGEGERAAQHQRGGQAKGEVGAEGEQRTGAQQPPRPGQQVVDKADDCLLYTSQTVSGEEYRPVEGSNAHILTRYTVEQTVCTSNPWRCGQILAEKVISSTPVEGATEEIHTCLLYTSRGV